MHMQCTNSTPTPHPTPTPNPNQVGKEGVITVQDGQTLENELEVVEGMKCARRVTRYLVITPSRGHEVRSPCDT